MMGMKAAIQILIICLFDVIAGDDIFESQMIRGKCMKMVEGTNCNDPFGEKYPELSRSFLNLSLADTYFYLFTNQSPQKAEFLHLCGGGLSENTHFRPDKPTVIMGHGYTESACVNTWMRDFKNEFLKRDAYNVIILDYAWSDAVNLGGAYENMRIASSQVAKLIDNIKAKTGVTADNFHLIGFSLGTVLFGQTGRKTPVGRVTALDPPGPYVAHLPKEYMVNKKSAKRVDIIHTSFGNCLPSAGGSDQLGHSDFYVNGGKHPRCIQTGLEYLLRGDLEAGIAFLIPPACWHLSSMEYFKATINPRGCEIWGTQCESYEKYKAGGCGKCHGKGPGCEIMGYDWELTHSPNDGISYYVDITTPCPYCGALFSEDHRNNPSELAFKYSVLKINKDQNLLPNTDLVYDIQYVPKDDSFHASKKACMQVSAGVSVIFGPQSPTLGNHIQSLCDALDIPHVEYRLDVTESERDKEFSINLHPSPSVLGQAIRDLTKYLNWTRVAVIYEHDTALVNLQELMKLPVPRNVQYVFRKTDPDGFRDALKDIKSRGIYSIVVDTKPANLPLLLKAILQVQMNDYKYYYHFVTLDIETYNLEDFKYNFVNMTAFRLVDSDHPTGRRILKEIEESQTFGHHIINKTNVIQTEPALIYDSVHALAWGLQALQGGATLRPANVSCEEEMPWTDGSSLFNYINSVEFLGLTGKIQFKEGHRANLKFDLLKLRQNNMEKVGEWSTNNKLNITNHAAFHEFGTTNITLRVTTIESMPHVMLRSDRNSTGNDRFEGFCIDLLRTIAELLGFAYELYLVPDNKFGAENMSSGEWSGLVKEIIEKNADLAVAPMTINYARESVIDFTKPFMNLGIGILFKLPKNMPVRLFSFMSPLAVDIWLYVLVAYVLVSSTMFIVARFSPYEWQNPHPCITDTDVMENQFSLGNSFWFTIVTLMHQGCDLNPRAVSTRIIGAIWWFFTLIMISSYTANLAAFLTVERMITPIESVEDLADQSKISYGTLDGGSTMTFFRDSKIETYQKMWRYMENRPSVFVSSYEEGVRRVLEGNYAFLMESTMLDYMVQRDCNLTQVGGLLDSKGYGIATPMGSPWRDKISLAILDLQEKGVIQMLYNKWWKSPGITCSRDDKNKDGKANALGVDNIGGVFVVLMCGLAVAILTSIFEFCWNSKKNAQSARKFCDGYTHGYIQQSVCAEMAEELRFAVKCRASRQRPALRRQCSKCIPVTTYVPAAIEVPQENGIMQMIDVRKSPNHFDYDS